MPESRRVAVVACVALAAVLGWAAWRWSASPGPGQQQGRAVAAGPSAGVLTRPAPAGTVVHVAGAVRHPGVYRLPGGSRVRDAVRRAGGPTHSGDANAINLAAKLADGQQVTVPRRVPAPGAAGAVRPQVAAGASGPLSLGSATAEQLDGLDGVGPATAAKIIAWRTQHGGFASVDDLGQVPGIGPRRLKALRPLVAP